MLFDAAPWLFFLVGNEGLVFALAPLAVTCAALFLFPLLELRCVGPVGDVGERGPEGDIGDLAKVETESETDSAFLKIWAEGLVEAGGEVTPPSVPATSDVDSAVAWDGSEVGAGTSATAGLGVGSATCRGEDGVGVVSRDAGEVDLGDGTGVVRTRFPPSEIVMKSLATVDPGIERLTAGLLQIRQKKFASLSPVLSCKRARLVE